MARVTINDTTVEVFKNATILRPQKSSRGFIFLRSVT